MIGLTRRAVLLAAGAVAVGAAAPRVDATSFGPPAAGPDAYGLRRFLKSTAPLESALRGLGEPALVTPEARVTGPTFRLLEISRQARAARVIFEAESGEPTVLLKQHPTRAAIDAMKASAPPGMFNVDSVLPGLLGVGVQRGLRLRVLLDDRDRFWDGAPEPPDWDQIDADEQGAILVTADGGLSLLEGHVGAKRHVILRRNPDRESWLGQLSEQLFGRSPA